MTTLLSLAWAFVREHSTRSLLTVFATAAAVCMVVWVCSGYDSLLTTYDEYADRALGTYPLAVAPIDSKQSHSIPPELLLDLRNDPAVAFADSMHSFSLPHLHQENRHPIATQHSSGPKVPTDSADKTETSFGEEDVQPADHRTFPTTNNSGQTKSERSIIPRRPDNLQIEILATDAANSPFPMAAGEWLVDEKTASSSSGIVLRSDFAQRYSLELGDLFQVNISPSNNSRTIRDLKIIGLIEAPNLITTGPYGIPILTPATGQGFITLETAENDLEQKVDISLIALALNESTDITKFRFGWGPKLSKYETPVQFQESIEIEEALDQAAAARNVKMQSYAATGMAMLVSILVITCTLSMGVTERSRQFALLRAITLTKYQLAFVVLSESLILGLGGLTLGLILAAGLLWLTQLVFGHILYHGITFGWYTLAFAATTAIGASVLAALLPIYNATRVRPIDALAVMAKPSAGYQMKPVRLGFAVLCILFNPIVSQLPLPPAILIVALTVGIISMSVGFVLLAPMLVLTVQKLATGFLCRLFSLNRDLVDSQLQPHTWRTSGAAISMALGTGLFVGIQVWGYTMLQAFVPGPWAPDAMVQFSVDALPAPMEDIAELTEIDSNKFTAVVVEQPRLLHDLTNSGNAPSVTRQDNVIIVGLQPDAAFLGSERMFQLQWNHGSAEEAVEVIENDRGCIVPEHFLLDTGLTVGDTFELVSPVDAEQVVTYKIAGSVQLDGWHWQTKMTGMRPRTHRAAAMIFANLQDVSNDFSIPHPTHAWFNLASNSVDLDELQTSIRKLTGESILQDKSSVSDLQEEYETVQVGKTRLIHVKDIRNHIQNVARRWIWIISQVPLVTVLIASIGVLNVLLASVRSRRREYGILVSIGFTQQELSRTVLLEGILVAIVACLLSFGFGISAGWGGSELAQYNSFFGGLHPPLVVPSLTLLVSATLVAIFAIGLSWWPAIIVGSAKPLQLLEPE